MLPRAAVAGPNGHMITTPRDLPALRHTSSPPAPRRLPPLRRLPRLRPRPSCLTPRRTRCATPPPAPPAGLSAASVPKILLGLGATCLLVAAVIFLAVAWSWLGIGGRTAVLVALTATTGLAGQWLARRDLGVAAEALTTVALGLRRARPRRRRERRLARDADRRGVPRGGRSAPSLVAVSFGAVPAGPAAVPPPARRAGRARAARASGVGAPTEHPQVVATVAVLGFAAWPCSAGGSAPWCCPWIAAVGAAIAFLALAGLALADAAEHPTLRGLWLEGHGLGLLAVAALSLLPWLAGRAAHDDAAAAGLRRPRCSVLTFAAALPVLRRGRHRDHAHRGRSVGGLGGRGRRRPAAVVRRPAGAARRVAARAGPGAAQCSPPAPSRTCSPSPSRSPPTRRSAWTRRARSATRCCCPWRSRSSAVAAASRCRGRLVRRAPVRRRRRHALLTAAQYPLPLWAFVAVLGPAGSSLVRRARC